VPAPASPPPRYDVLGVGVAALDHVIRLDHWPAADEKVKTDNLLITGGGTVATALVTVARLGRSAAYAGAVGDDAPGREVLAGLASEGVDVSLATVTPAARTPWAFCVAHGDQRNVYSVRGTSPPLRPSGLACDCRILHLDGSEEASVEWAREARRRGVLVSLDGGSVRASSSALLEHVDYLVMSETFLRDLEPGVAPEAALRRLWVPARRLVAVTRGARGTLACEGGPVYEVPAEPVEVVDTTGAGDVFHGAFLVGILEGLSSPRALAFAAHVAALKCRKLGGREGIARRAELGEWLG